MGIKYKKYQSIKDSGVMLEIVEDWPARSGNYANDATFHFTHSQVKYD